MANVSLTQNVSTTKNTSSETQTEKKDINGSKNTSIFSNDELIENAKKRRKTHLLALRNGNDYQKELAQTKYLDALKQIAPKEYQNLVNWYKAQKAGHARGVYAYILYGMLQTKADEAIGLNTAKL